MWSEALRMLEQADRLHRQFFLAHEPASWEPPVDVVEHGDELCLQVALPGVSPNSVTVATDADGITLSALRSFPCREQGERIHRVEIPYGRFQRRIEFPVHLYELKSKSQGDGILTLIFRRKEGA
jgi:HSP20 family molecular chaperone IbpA